MLIQATFLNNNAVRSLEELGIVGRISDIIVDPENGQLLALVLAKFLGAPEVISPMDIVSFSPGNVLIKTKDAILPLKDIVRAQKIWQEKIRLIGSLCKTESGKILGTIDDFLIDLDTMLVAKYYVGGNHILAPLAPNRIILANKTIKIKKGLVTVQDEEQQMTDKAVADTIT